MKQTIIILGTILLLSILLAAQTHTFPALDSDNTFTGANTFNGNLLVSTLTPGNCVQATSGGLLTTASGPCGTSSGTLTATGSPVAGNLAKWSGATSLTNADLAGDAVTSGTATVIVAKVNGVSYPTLPSTHQVPIVTAAGTATYKTIPDCQDTSGNHLNYMQSTDVISCGSTGVPSLQLFSNKNLAFNVSITANTLTTVDSISVTMPASGGPWRALISYTYFNNGGVNVQCYVTDGTRNWGLWEQNTSNNITDCAASQWSPVTYANGANVTFTVKEFNTGAATVTTVGSLTGSVPSSMQVAAFASN